MRLGPNASHLASLVRDELCPCCTSDLARVRADMASVSQTVARPLAQGLIPHLGPLLDAIRQNGRSFFDELAGSFRDGRNVQRSEPFEACLKAFALEVAALDAKGQISNLSTEDAKALSVLRSALGQLGQSVGCLVTDLKAAEAEKRCMDAA